MLIYPDSNDRINLCHGSASIDIADFAQEAVGTVP